MRSAALGLLVVVAASGSAPAKTTPTSCTTCHADAARVGEERARIVRAFETDVHAEVGLSCHDCHGGNPDVAVAADVHAAKDAERSDGPYVGAPARTAVPGFCGRCHSNPEYMKRFRPDARVDQEREYWTSRHGALLRKGDQKVATCIDCHGVHGIARPSDPRSSVYPTHVAETCRGCHADSQRMAGYTLEDGRPIPIDQYERWMSSVHAAAMFKKEDLSAPTCNDCHGNHGATPPGLTSISFVCGRCHEREAELFRGSPKHAGFEAHNEFLAGMEEGSETPCRPCHESEPAGQLKGVRRFGECTTCHSNHAIVRPTMAMLGPLPETPCLFCHEAPHGGESVFDEGALKNYRQMRDALLESARQQGLEGDVRFDWLVEQLQMLPQHTETAAAGGGLVLKPEFRRLFEKFRIGPTHLTFTNPVSGQPTTESMIRCTSCHPPQTTGKDGEITPSASSQFLGDIRMLTADIASTDRMLLGARRGGVAVSGASASLDRAIDAQIQLEVLVHSFSTAKDGAFSRSAAEGLKHVQAANSMAVAALEELQFRRKGLAASLLIILLVLIGLGLKIREISRRRARAADEATGS